MVVIQQLTVCSHQTTTHAIVPNSCHESQSHWSKSTLGLLDVDWSVERREDLFYQHHCFLYPAIEFMYLTVYCDEPALTMVYTLTISCYEYEYVDFDGLSR